MATQFNDGLLPGSRRPRLYLAKGGEVQKFTGENIPGFCAIAARRFEKNGKWSNTTYQLDLAAGVRPLHLVSPMHGKWGDHFASWGEVVEALGLPIEVAQELVRGEYKATAERLDKLEEFALATEAEGGETETVVVSFGSPSNRASREGYWEQPKSAMSSDGRTVTIEPGGNGAGWGAPVVVEPQGGRIISSRHRPGMSGGYWTVEVAVPIAQ